MKEVAITSEYIKLDQFLKLADITGSGGEARIFISENTILVNGEKENRRGRKIRPNDTVNIGGQIYKVIKTGEKV